MSLWTPDGEHDVPRPETGQLDPEQHEQAEQLAAEMAEVRKQLLSVPASVVVANHAMGLYELAAIHLGSPEPDLGQAQVAIDGFGALVDALGDRLGENAETLRDALGQIRLAYVQVKGALAADDDPSRDGQPAD